MSKKLKKNIGEVVMYKPYVYQLFSALLMVAQSLILPIFIGLDSFGAQMLMLSPVLFAQSLLEPVFQSMQNKISQSSGSAINVYEILVMLVVGLLVFVLLLSWLHFSFDVFLFLFLFLYFANTFFISYFFSIDDIFSCNLSSVLLASGYLCSMSFFVFFGIASGYEVLFANILAFLASTVFMAFRYKTYGNLRYSFQKIDSLSLVYDMLYRLPTISFSTLSFYFLGVLGFSYYVLGQYRVFLSAINAGKYFNIVPLPRLQAFIEMYCSKNLKNYQIKVFYLYVIFVLIYVALLSLFFPLAFSESVAISFLDRLFLFCSGFLLFLQPLAYLVRVVYRKSRLLCLIFPLFISFISLIVFIGTTYSFRNPYMGAAIAIGVSFLLYLVVVLWFNNRRFEQ